MSKPAGLQSLLALIFFNRLSLVIFYSFWFLIGLLVLRKSQNALEAVRYVKAHSASVSLDSLEGSTEFRQLLEEDFPRPPAFFLLNQYALNMTDNFLCNTATLAGAHERFVFVTLDEVARKRIRSRWPRIRVFHWPTPSLYVSLVMVGRYENCRLPAYLMPTELPMPILYL